MLTIYIDADACPVKKEACRVANRYRVPVIMVANRAQRVPPSSMVILKVVDGAIDAADDWIVKQLSEDDIVVTADIPLASRCLAKGAAALSPTGKRFTEENIGEAVATRDLLAKLRETGTLVGGPTPFQKKDASRFLQALDALIQSFCRKNGPL